MHIYDFILDDFQYGLKYHSKRITKNEPFENTFAVYRDLFLQHFDKIDCNATSTNLHKSIADNPGITAWFTKYCQIIKRDKAKIEALFNDILEIYELLISGKHQTAVNMLYHKLEKYDLLDDVLSEQLGSTFRIRKIRDGDDPNVDSYYHHIPYNLRFLISNQRFSFTGIPLHYAGMSMMASFFELGASNLDDDTYGLCMFAFDHLAHLGIGEDFEKIRKRNKIYDISNSLYEIVNDLFYTAIEQGKTINESLFYSITPQTFIREFRKFVLSSLCTFPKYKDSPFIEEYILPQLLTEAIRQHKYDGIIYPSTRFLGKNVVINSDWKSNFFMNNIVLFTIYSPRKLHDFTLYKNYIPARLDLSGLSAYDAFHGLGKIENAVNSMEDFLITKVPLSELSYGFRSILRNFKKKVKLYPHIVIDEVPYLETRAGKAEVMYLEEYMKFIGRQIKSIYPDELDALMEEKAKETGS